MCLTNYIDFPGFSRGFGDLWFVRLKGFIRHWRRRSLPVSPHYRCELLEGSIICYAVHWCIVLDIACPHPGATINIQVGSSLTKGGGGQTKNLGKLQARAKYIKHYETWIPNPAMDGDNSCSVMENIGQMRNRLVSSALQVLVNKKLLRVRFTPWVFFKHLFYNSSFAVWPAGFRQHGNSGNCSCVHRLSRQTWHRLATPSQWPPSSLVRTWLIRTWKEMLATDNLKTEVKAVFPKEGGDH